MSDTTITSITSIVSLTIGWLLNEFGSWFKERRENKRILKNVLFHLLEMLHSFQKLNISKDISKITEMTMKWIPEIEKVEGAKEELNKFYLQIFSGIFEQNVKEELAELEGNYIKSVEQLSHVNPVMAYRLKGRNKIMQGFEIMNHSISEMQNIIGINDSETTYVEPTQFVNILKPDIVEASISTLKEEIIEIAKCVGIKTLKDVKYSFEKNETDISKDEDFIKYEQLIKKVATQMQLQIPNNQ